MQGQFWHPPIRELADVNFVLVPAINFVHGTELFQLFARGTKLAENLSVQFHFVNFTVVHVGGCPSNRPVCHAPSRSHKVRDLIRAGEGTRSIMDFEVLCVCGPPAF